MLKVTAFFFSFFFPGEILNVSFGEEEEEKKKLRMSFHPTPTNTKWTRSNCFWVEKEQFNLSHSIIFLPTPLLTIDLFFFFFLSLFFILIYLSFHNHLSLILNTPLVSFYSPPPLFFITSCLVAEAVAILSPVPQ